MPSAKGSLGQTALIAAKADHTGLVTVDAEFAPTTTAVTTAADIAFIANQKDSTGLTLAGLSATIDLVTDHFGSSVRKLINSFRLTDEDAAAASEVKRYENGVPKGTPNFLGTVTGTGTTATGVSNDLVAINYIGEDPDDTANILVDVMLCNFTQDSGGFTTNYADATVVKMTLQSRAAKDDLVIPIAMFDATLVTPAAVQTIPEGSHYVMLSLPKAA